jgi:Putative zinc-finger
MDHQIAVRENLADRYLLNELDDRVREDFEEHYFTCEQCAEDVRLGARFVQNARSVFHDELAPPVRQTAPQRPRWAQWFWNPVPAYALAAALAVAVVVQRSPDGSALQPRAISAVELRPATRGTAQVIRLAPDQKSVELIVGAAAGLAYTCTVANRNGQILSSIETPVLQTSQLILLLPADALRDGPFTLVVRSRPGTGEAFTEQYEFTIQP